MPIALNTGTAAKHASSNSFTVGSPAPIGAGSYGPVTYQGVTAPQVIVGLDGNNPSVGFRGELKTGAVDVGGLALPPVVPSELFGVLSGSAAAAAAAVSAAVSVSTAALGQAVSIAERLSTLNFLINEDTDTTPQRLKLIGTNPPEGPCE